MTGTGLETPRQGPGPMEPAGRASNVTPRQESAATTPRFELWQLGKCAG